MQWFAFDSTPGNPPFRIEHVRESPNASSFFVAGENHLIGLAISQHVPADFFSFEKRYPAEDGLEIKLVSKDPNALQKAARAAAQKYREWTKKPI